MSYTVLARKYRPQSFDEVLGQEHVTTTLKNALDSKRIHHAYLFTGVRGTGKTSLARILAKALNCVKGPTPEPCNQCSACLEIARGNFLDVLEIDGASHTSVDNVRDLREQVQYVPAQGRYKVTLIDEVHMLSTSAFNALLKTLEEPPPHVVFLFATTEAQKIPITILSRCLRFDLRRLSQIKIEEQLAMLCQKEEVEADTLSLKLLARYAGGSMRDALSLLDRAIGLCGKEIQLEKLENLLGLTSSHWIEGLTQEILQGNLEAALKKSEELYAQGLDLSQVALQWVDYLHDLVLLKSAGPQALPNLSKEELESRQSLIQASTLDDLQVAFEILYKSAEQIHRSEVPKVLWDLLLVKLVHGAPFQPIDKLLNSPGLQEKYNNSSQLNQLSNSTHYKDSPKINSEARHLPEQASYSASQSPGPTRQASTQAIKFSPPIQALVNHALETRLEDEAFVVIYEKDSLWTEMLLEKQDRLAKELEKVLNKNLKVRINEREETSSKKEASKPKAEHPLMQDKTVREAVEILGAEIVDREVN